MRAALAPASPSGSEWLLGSSMPTGVRGDVLVVSDALHLPSLHTEPTRAGEENVGNILQCDVLFGRGCLQQTQPGAEAFSSIGAGGACASGRGSPLLYHVLTGLSSSSDKSRQRPRAWQAGVCIAVVRGEAGKPKGQRRHAEDMRQRAGLACQADG